MPATPVATHGLEASLYATLVEMCPLMLFTVERDGTVRSANRAAIEQLGYSEDEMLGHPVLDVFDPADRESVARNLADAFERRGDASAWEFRKVRKDGSRMWVRELVRIVEDDRGTPLAFVVCEDITAAKDAAQKIRDVEARRAAAQKAAEERAADLERSNRDLEQFAYVASHDLQEPLRVVKGYLDLLDRRVPGLDERARSYLQKAREGSVRMQTLIDDLLAYSRVGTRGHDFEAVDAREAFDAAVENLRVALQESGGDVAAGAMPRVLGDKAQITQLFQNLVGNALKFRRGDPPRVRVEATPGDGQWTFSVSDNGIGIDPKDHGRLFVIFQRLHGEEYPGTGIGLALCKRIVERHGGRIWIESEAGRGSVFRFTLPEVPP